MSKLTKEQKELLSEKLNFLLANLHVFYQNSRGFHWNIKGEQFFALHLKYEEIYTDLFQKTDDVAERILALDGEPIYKYQQAIDESKIKTAEETKDAESTVRQVVESLEILIEIEREILAIAGEAGDEGTLALVSAYVQEQEKAAWMYKAFLK